MKHTTDILIVGGGIIGCAIAYHLRKYNIQVSVLEKDKIGSQASSAAAGLLAPLGPLSGPGPFADLLLASFSLFPSLITELETLTNLSIDYKKTGALRTVSNLKRVTHLQKRMLSWQPLGLQMHWLTGNEARQMEPLLAPEICAAVYAPEEAQINAPQLVQAFSQAATKLGANIYPHTEVIAIQHNQQRVTGVQTATGELITCQHLILSTGSWTGLYSNWFNSPLPVTPLKGQILSLQEPEPTLRHIIFGGAIYLAPGSGHIIAGATKEETGFDAQVTEEGTAWLQHAATKLAPTLQASKIERAWAGLRPKTPDGHPILGALPGWENVTLAAGHNSVGIILSAITGQAIAESLATGKVPAIIRPFSCARFAMDH